MKRTSILSIATIIVIVISLGCSRHSQNNPIDRGGDTYPSIINVTFLGYNSEDGTYNLDFNFETKDPICDGVLIQVSITRDGDVVSNLIGDITVKTESDGFILRIFSFQPLESGTYSITLYYGGEYWGECSGTVP